MSSLLNCIHQPSVSAVYIYHCIAHYFKYEKKIMHIIKLYKKFLVGFQEKKKKLLARTIILQSLYIYYSLFDCRKGFFFFISYNLWKEINWRQRWPHFFRCIVPTRRNLIVFFLQSKSPTVMKKRQNYWCTVLNPRLFKKPKKLTVPNSE